MIVRILTLSLCALFIAAAAGRYSAEERVRDTRREIAKLERERAEEERAIQTLRAEIAYLENPNRLAEIATEKTALRPPDSEQLLTAHGFALAMGAGHADPADRAPPPTFIADAIAMAALDETE